MRRVCWIPWIWGDPQDWETSLFQLIWSQIPAHLGLFCCAFASWRVQSCLLRPRGFVIACFELSVRDVVMVLGWEGSAMPGFINRYNLCRELLWVQKLSAEAVWLYYLFWGGLGCTTDESPIDFRFLIPASSLIAPWQLDRVCGPPFTKVSTILHLLDCLAVQIIDSQAAVS